MATDSADILEIWRLNSHLSRLSHRVLMGEDLIVAEDWQPTALQFLEVAAQESCRVYITSSARLYQSQAKLRNAVVPAAKRSNHLVGEAFDCNFMLRGQLYNSKALGNFDTLPDEIRQSLSGSVRTAVICRSVGVATSTALIQSILTQGSI